jgi:hypothetical protein
MVPPKEGVESLRAVNSVRVPIRDGSVPEKLSCEISKVSILPFPLQPIPFQLHFALGELQFQGE